MRACRGTIAVQVDAINKAIAIFGSETSLAAALGVSRQILNYWKHNMVIPLDKALKICVITNGKIGLAELYPGLSTIIKQYHLLILKSYGYAVKPIN